VTPTTTASRAIEEEECRAGVHQGCRDQLFGGAPDPSALTRVRATVGGRTAAPAGGPAAPALPGTRAPRHPRRTTSASDSTSIRWQRGYQAEVDARLLIDQ
jgi:hypothetical protein